MLDASHIYAVVRHTSGRVDFETLDLVVMKNKADFEAGHSIKRAVLAVEETTVKAQEVAKQFRDRLKEKHD